MKCVRCHSRDAHEDTPTCKRCKRRDSLFLRPQFPTSWNKACDTLRCGTVRGGYIRATLENASALRTLTLEMPRRQHPKACVSLMEEILVCGTTQRAHMGLCSMARSLGFELIASAWEGKCVTGRTIVSFNERAGCLTLKGPKVPERLVHEMKQYGGELRAGGAWGFDVVDVHECVSVVKTLVLSHFAYPVFDFDSDKPPWDALKDDVTYWMLHVRDRPEASTTLARGEQYSVLQLPNGTLRVRTIYNREWTAKIKRLPKRERKWDRVQSAWLIGSEHRQYVLDTCEETLS